MRKPVQAAHEPVSLREGHCPALARFLRCAVLYTTSTLPPTSTSNPRRKTTGRMCFRSVIPIAFNAIPIHTPFWCAEKNILMPTKDPLHAKILLAILPLSPWTRRCWRLQCRASYGSGTVLKSGTSFASIPPTSSKSRRPSFLLRSCRLGRTQTLASLQVAACILSSGGLQDGRFGVKENSASEMHGHTSIQYY